MTLLLSAFHCLLRAGDALQLAAFDFALGKHIGVCSLKGTKPGKRNAADEAISITDTVAISWLLWSNSFALTERTNRSVNGGALDGTSMRFPVAYNFQAWGIILLVAG